MAVDIFDPRMLSRAEFVGGPGRTDAVAVDEVFVKDLEALLDDQDPSAIEIRPAAVVTLSALNRDFRFVGVDGGVLMMEGEAIAGAYLGFDVAVAENWQGQGLGAELVLERAMRDGGVPQWEADKIGYSRGGLRAHEKAWEMAGDREFFARKAARLILATLKAGDVADDDAATRVGTPVLWTAEDWLVERIRKESLPAVLGDLSDRRPAP